MSNGWDSGLEAEFDSVVDGLWAHNSSFLGEELETTDASGGLIVIDALEVFFIIDDNFAWDILWVFTFESLYLCDNELSVLGDSIIHNFFNKTNIRFSASNENLTFHKLDETL